MKRWLLSAAFLIAVPAAFAAADEPVKKTRFAEACDLAARETLVRTMTFSPVDIEDYTLEGEAEVDVDYDAVSQATGKVYPSSFACLFVDAADPANIVLKAAAEGGRPYGDAAVAVLNHILKDAGFQK